MVCKYWDGTTHIDVGGNVKFINNVSVDTICKVLEDILLNPKGYMEMKKVAEDLGKEQFSYFNIAKQSILIR